MTGYLRRLISSLGAYQVSNVVAKLIGVALLPVYTAYINRSGYGTIELLANGVILISILARLGMIEAFLRFYYEDEDTARRNHLIRRATVFMLVATTVTAALLLALAGPLSRVALGRHEITIFRVAVLGLWSFTNLELAYAVLRVDERLRAYATASVCNVLLTVAATVTLVVGAGLGARGYLLGNYGASTIVLLALWWTLRHRLRDP
jgi:O-antigen/teichoic acid export membrane protein